MTDSSAGRARVLERHARIPGTRVVELSDATGQVGGYVVSGPVMDGPIAYLDADGELVGTFHIFSNPQKTERSPGAIDTLTKAFPIQQALVTR